MGGTIEILAQILKKGTIAYIRLLNVSILKSIQYHKSAGKYKLRPQPDVIPLRKVSNSRYPLLVQMGATVTLTCCKRNCK